MGFLLINAWEGFKIRQKKNNKRHANTKRPFIVSHYLLPFLPVACFFFFKLVECAHSQNVSNSLRSRKISFPEATFDLDLTQTAQEYIMAQ